MDALATKTSTPAVRRSSGSWGAVLAILLILALIVAGAYYALTDRLAAIHEQTVAL